MIERVEAELEAFYDRGSAGAANLAPDGPDLWRQLRAAGTGGKQFRPRVLLQTHQALCGQRDDAAVRLAAATELLHTAFVIHDDVIDGDHSRRGRPNVSGHYLRHATTLGIGARGAYRLSEAAAILAGDLALTGAVEMVATCGAPTAMTYRLLDNLHHAVSVSAAGELADVRLSVAPEASKDEVLTMTRRKTAAYSFALPLQWGAQLAGASAQTLAQLSRVGAHLGLAFQLHDDLLGVFGSEARTGKSELCDLREGKHTALISAARQSAQWPELAPLVGDPGVDSAGLERARELLIASGAARFVTDLADTELGRADDALAPLDLPNSYTSWLLDVPRLPQQSAA